MYSIMGLSLFIGVLLKLGGDSSKEAPVEEQVVNLLGNRLITFGISFIMVRLFLTGHPIIASIPTLMVIKGVMFDSFNTNRLRQLIAEEDNK